MHAYLAWLLFEKIYRAGEWYEGEAEKIKKYSAGARQALEPFEQKVVENRARRLASDFRDSELHTLGKMYWHELNDDDGDDFIPAYIDYDPEHYRIWSDAVRKKLTVRMTYDSTTSGTLERLVDPYKTHSPYGDAYCHTRKEVRKFRFDRIIDISLTEKKFTKPENWRELIQQKPFLPSLD